MQPPAHIRLIISSVYRTAVILAVVSCVQTNLDFFLCTVGIEPILLAVNDFFAGHHCAVCVEIVFLTAESLPAGFHDTVCAEVVLLAADILETGLHGTICGKVVFFAVYRLHAGLCDTIVSKIIVFAADILHASLHGVVVIEVIAAAMILYPTGHRSTVLIVIRYRIIGELAKSQLLGTSFAVALIAYPVYGEFSGCFSGIRTDIVAVIAVADPAAVRLSGFRIVVSPHTVYRQPVFCAPL